MGTIMLYHGSNAAINHPVVSHNTGFADLGRGFYLTTNHEAARSRAAQRAHKAGGTATVSAFELDEQCVPWLTLGARALQERTEMPSKPFGLQFDETPEGLTAWAAYIKSCREGKTDVPGAGSPSVVRAWIATMEIEMVCSGFLTPEELAQAIEPSDLIVQYCILSQDIIDHSLTLVRTEVING